jgi:serine protease AprX
LRAGKLTLVGCVLAVAAGVVRAEAPLDPRVFAGRAQEGTASFLVVLREQADLSAATTIPEKKAKTRFVFETLRSLAVRSQADLLRGLREAGVRHRSFFLVNMIEVEGDRALALDLASRREVLSIEANLPWRSERPDPVPAASAFPGAPAAMELANLELIGAPVAWARGFTGQEIAVGVADTGFLWEHPALRDRYRGFDGVAVAHDYNWHDAVHDAAPGNLCGSDALSPCDDDGHGTGTAGIAVGSDGGDNHTGVAPDARFLGCRNMDRGVGTPARYAECFEFFLAPTDRTGANPRPDLAPDVINNSWGCLLREGCTDPNILRTVVENIVAAGIFVVVSAGNSGPQCSTIDVAPAIYELSFSVGATSFGDAIAGFSSRGPVTVDGSNRLKPDLVAPGVFIRAPLPPDGYGPLTGTSAAGPHVAGAVALVWSAAPELRGRIEETAELLRRTSQPLTSNEGCGAFVSDAVPNAVFGWGRLDVGAAVEAARPIARSTPVLPQRAAGPRTVRPRP